MDSSDIIDLGQNNMAEKNKKMRTEIQRLHNKATYKAQQK